MGFFKSAKGLVSHIIDLRVHRWADLNGHIKTNNYFWSLAKKLLKVPGSSVQADDFEAAVQRQGISLEILSEQAEYYKNWALLFVGLSALLMAYAALLCYLHNWMGLCIDLALMVYTLCTAFRFHFWHFQISTQKLGCSLKEWAQFLRKTHSDNSRRS